MEKFKKEVMERLISNGSNSALRADGAEFMKSSLNAQYSYNFSWMGRPIIQYPQDVVAMQEIIWSVQPDLIIETGIAHGGSLIFSAAMLELNAACGGEQSATVLGIDVDIRPHNRAAIENHPMFKRIDMLEGSSIDPEIISKVYSSAKGKKKILVLLDSNHTHDHVLAELQAYAPLVTKGSYCVVFDTIVEDTAECCPSDRPWGLNNNPKTAVFEYLKNHSEFEIDSAIDCKLIISVAPNGYMRRAS
jgi:cephalosporin hydroxylase